RGVTVPRADRHREGLAGEPGLLEAPLLPLRVGDETCLLVLERHARRQAEPEAARVVGDGVDAELLAERVEEHVARLDDGPVQVDGAVPARLPAAEEVIPEGDAPTAVHARV